MEKRKDLWEERYIEMEHAVGADPVEREVLSMLRQGHTPLQCMKRSGMSPEAFSDLFERAREWEIKNLCVSRTDMNKKGR